MAKGRKLTASRSERFLGGYSSGRGALNDASEFVEDDVWGSVNETADGDSGPDDGLTGDWTPHADVPEVNGTYDTRRQIPRADRNRRQIGGLSLAFEDSGRSSSSRIVHQHGMAASGGRHMATSAPVNVPDWSKIYRVNSVESLVDSDEGLDENGAEIVPPHEYLAREYARSRNTATNSVFEGVGRKLKGRDLSRVRDAVWSQTGFYG